MGESLQGSNGISESSQNGQQVAEDRAGAINNNNRRRRRQQQQLQQQPEEVAAPPVRDDSSSGSAPVRTAPPVTTTTRNNGETFVAVNSSSRRRRRNNNNNDEQIAKALAKELYAASETLLDRLFSYLSKLPEEQEQEEEEDNSSHDDDVTNSRSRTTTTAAAGPAAAASHHTPGLTLPASAVGWISSQLCSVTTTVSMMICLNDGDDDTNAAAANSARTTTTAATMCSSMSDRFRLLRFLLPRATHIRITRDPWPSSSPRGGGVKQRQRQQQQQQQQQQQKRRLTGASNVRGQEDNVGVDGNTTTTTTTTTTAEDNIILSFLEFYEKLIHKPRIDMRVFPNCQVLLLDQVSPEWVFNLESVRHSLQVLRLERSCIFNLNKLLATNSSRRQSSSDRAAAHDYCGVTDGNSRNNEQNGSSSPLLDDDDSSVINANTDDPLYCPPLLSLSPSSSRLRNRSCYTSLTHIKLSHCGLSEFSGLQGGQRVGDRHGIAAEEDGFLLPPMALLPNVQSVCLSHNEIISEESALAGLSAMTSLSKLDLSYNSIISLATVHCRVGNIQTLILTRNNIKSVRGIDRLFSLEKLWLDHNQLSDMAAVSGLARLPELQELRLKGNPFKLTYNYSTRRRRRQCRSGRRRRDTNHNRNRDNGRNSRLYRLSVLDLFREIRIDDLPPRATFRDLQSALPVLDDQPATMDELKAMRGRSFSRSIRINVQNTASATSSKNQHSVDDANFSSQVERVASMSSETPKEDRKNTIDEKGEAQPRQTLPLASVLTTTRRKERKRHQALIIDELNTDSTSTHLPISRNRRKSSSTNPLGPKVNFSIVDVLCSLSRPEKLTEKKKINEVPFNLDEPNQEDSLNDSGLDNAIAGLSEGSTQSKNSDNENEHQNTCETLDEISNSVEENRFNSQDERGESAVQDSESRSDESVPDILEAGSGHGDMAVVPTTNLSREFDKVELSPIKNGERHDNDSILPNSITLEEEDSTPVATSPQSTVPLNLCVPSADEEQNSRRSIASDSSGNRSTESHSATEQIALRVVSVPGGLWEHGDNISVPSSAGSPHREVSTGSSNSNNKFLATEKNSVYCGPDIYKDMPILENLELYFRLFVFANSSPANAIQRTPFSADNDDGDEDNLDRYPRIQLYSIDRRLRDAIATAEKLQMIGKSVASGEVFRRVWREKIIACGRPALRRLTPNRSARLGFHGELLWSAESSSHLSPDTFAKCREVVVCFSDTALYLILDYDAVTTKAKDEKRDFPFPIPKDAVFKDAKWPHALVRHPFQTLRVITIGFGFQRVTLRFSNSTYPCPDDFTYILLTSNKLETVVLLKELQELAAKSRACSGLVGTNSAEGNAIKIENDDPQVLDAISVAVAPDTIGAVLHYQLLEQRWRRGDRGSVRRVCVVTDTKLFLLDEDYVGDGCSESVEAVSGSLGDTVYRLVDSAALSQVLQVQAADADPNAITIVISPESKLQRNHNWRLLCRDRHGAEQLVEDVRKAMQLAE